MKKFSIGFSAFFVFSFFLLSCSEDSIEKEDPKSGNEGIRLKYFNSTQAITHQIESFLLEGFELTDGSEIKEFGDYENGLGGYEYSCSWLQITPLDPNPGEYRESVTVNGVPQGWDINDEHEKTTKAELLENHEGYEEIVDSRLLEAPYEDHVIVLKNKANKKGDWDFLAFIDPTHHIDGDGQRAGFSGFFSPSRTVEKAKYDVPSDETAVSIFIQLLESIN